MTSERSSYVDADGVEWILEEQARFGYERDGEGNARIMSYALVRVSRKGSNDSVRLRAPVEWRTEEQMGELVRRARD